MSELVLGINGLGRVGKLTLWTQLGRDDFSKIVVNVGREVGTSLQSILDHIMKDSTYGSLSSYLFGIASRKEVEVQISTVQENHVVINGKEIVFLKTDRDPCDIDWSGVDLVVDTTGKFNDPDRRSTDERGSVIGHFDGSPSVKKVVLSSPFKIERGGASVPDDAVVVVLGINDDAYNPLQHRIISNASCTTTCLAHTLKPLVNHFGADALKAFSMEAVHAATSKQTVLDRVPAAGDDDPCKSRSAMNNIFLTTTGAAKTLGPVMPEIAHVSFIAQSIRIPTMTGSLVVLTADIASSDFGEDPKETVNNIMRAAAAADKKHYLKFSEIRNVSSDVIGAPFAAALIEGSQTVVAPIADTDLMKVRVYGWYDNELASYVNMLGDQIVTVANSIR